MPTRFSDLEAAFAFVSGGVYGEHRAFLDRQSGEIYWRSEVGGDLDEMPDDIDDDSDDEKYVEIPHRNDLGLGKPLVLDFVGQFLPGDLDEVRRIFSRKGAYGRFRALLESRGALDRWYDFSNKAEAAALREWCADNGVELAD